MDKINKNRHNVDFVLKRLKELTNSKRDNRLAEILDVQPRTLSAWKSRGTMDYALIIDFCILNDLDLNEVFTGELRYRTKNEADEFALKMLGSMKYGISSELEEMKHLKKEILQVVEYLKTKQELTKAKELIERRENG